MAIKLIIFDLDGVLVDCKDLHYEALNRALINLGEHPIGRDEHLAIYDGLNTRAKLNLLSDRRGLRKEYHKRIFEDKQTHTLTLIEDFRVDDKIRELLKRLFEEGYKLCVASNSIAATVLRILEKKGFLKYIHFWISNEDVKNPKPHPEMYMKAMIKAEASPKETLIIEDSHIGRKGAEESGAFVCPVKDSSEVTYERIMKYASQEKPKAKWDAGELNVLIPMAGAGSRFSQAGYTFPKPLIEVNGKPMIQVVVDNLNVKANYIYIVQEEHYFKYNLQTMLNLITPNCHIIPIVKVTEGAAVTALLARELINNETPLLIANSDQFLEWDSAEFLYSMTDNVDGGIVTFKSTHPKWSFAKIEEGWVSEVAEKNPISDNATAGIYYWKKGSNFVRYADQMIRKDIRTNNEFYIAPVYNEAIKHYNKIKAFQIEKMWGLGTPEDLQTYLNHKNV